MASLSSSSKEKVQYWERRLGQLLRPLGLVDLLRLCWAIEAFREGRVGQASRYVNFPGEPKDHNIPGKFFIPPWAMESVVREKLLQGTIERSDAKRLNLKSWTAVAKLFNAYTCLANLDGVKDFEANEILAAMPRLFWPQYDWQLGYANTFRIGRAWHVYATDEGKRAFCERYGIDLETFLKIGFAMFAATSEHFALSYSYFQPLGVTKSQVGKVRSIIGGTLEEQARFARETTNLNIPRDFQRSVTKERPLFEVDGRDGKALIAPFRSNLLLRITDGLYYDIVSDPRARQRSGDAFEDLCLRVTHHYMGSTCSVEAERTSSYGKSADIIAEEKTGGIGIVAECKIRRLPQRVLTSPDPWRDCSEDFEDVIKGIVQIWRTHQEFYEGSERKVAGLVIQFDPWTVMGNAFIDKLFEVAHAEADRLNISQSSRVPVALAGFADAERSMGAFSCCELYRAICKSNTDKFRGYELAGILRETLGKKERHRPFDYSSLAQEAVPWWGSFGSESG